LASAAILTISGMSLAPSAMAAQGQPATAKGVAAEADRLSGEGKFGEAFKTAEQAVGLARAKPRDLDGMATALTAACTHAAPIDIQKSLAYCEEAAVASEAAYGADAVKTLSARASVAQLYTVFGRIAEADALYGVIISGLEAKPSLDDVGRKELAANHCYRAQARFVLGRWADSEADFKEAIARLSVLPPAVGVSDLSVCQTWLADRYMRWGRYEDARVLLADALKVREAHFPANHPDTADTLGVYGDLLTRMGRYDEAEPLLRRALNIAETADAPQPGVIGRSLQNLGKLYLATGRVEEAAPLLERAAGIYLGIGDAGRNNAATAYFDLAKAYRDAGRFAEGLPFAEKALELARTAKTAPGTDAEILIAKARLEYGRGDLAAGDSSAREAVSIYRAVGPASARLGGALAAAAEGSERRGDLVDARAKYAEADELLGAGGLTQRSRALVKAGLARANLAAKVRVDDAVYVNGGQAADSRAYAQEAWHAGDAGADILTADLIAVSKAPGQKLSAGFSAETRSVFQTAVDAAWAYGETIRP
jgi:tetratricopeptide (TPR) repeat protein